MKYYASSVCMSVWHYSWSGRQLLIRDSADIAIAGGQNTDLIFSSVFYLDTVDIFWGIEVSPPLQQELDLIQAKSGIQQDEDHIYFVLASKCSDDSKLVRRNVIGAGQLEIMTNTLGVFETSLLPPAIDGKPGVFEHRSQ